MTGEDEMTPQNCQMGSNDDDDALANKSLEDASIACYSGSTKSASAVYLQTCTQLVTEYDIFKVNTLTQSREIRFAEPS